VDHCLGFIIENIKAIVMKKRTLAFYTFHRYTFCMTKKDLLMGGWVGLGQFSALQTVQCINNNRINIKFYKVDYGACVRCGGGNTVQAQKR
jgi:hypothetical protein